MPYKIHKEHNKYVVTNIDTGKVMGTHDTESAANKQVQMLYMKTKKEDPRMKMMKKMIK